jgi:hypothetical protein
VVTSIPGLLARIEGGFIRAYDLSATPSAADLSGSPAMTVVPMAAFPLGADVDGGSPAVAPDLSHAVYAAEGAVVSVDSSGQALWRAEVDHRLRRNLR